MLTAKVRKEDIVEALGFGADDYVTKPFDAAELQARVRAGERIVNLEAALQQGIDKLEDALAHVKQLQGTVPICAWCKRIRDDSDCWSNVEDYISRHWQAESGHGICPEGLKERLAQEAVST